MYNYNEYNKAYIDTNECTSRGACSVAPNIAALQELIMYMLKHISHYVLELEKLGANNQSIKIAIINSIATLVSSNEFSEKQLFSLLQNEYQLLLKTKETYKELCTSRKIPVKELKFIVQFNENTTIAKAIGQGEKLFLQKCTKLTQTKKNLREILLFLVKSTCLNLVKSNDFNKFEDCVYQQILKTLDLLAHDTDIKTSKIKELINEFATADNKLQLNISNLLTESFGAISKVDVSHSTRKGKAILVSGNNFFDLLKILEDTKDKDIDIYTHSNLLITHAFAKFNQYEHLIGHFGDTTENGILDFATFPGAILLTKNSRNNTEYLYRGRLYSNDYIVPQGVVKIENDDFSPVIEASYNAKGFSKGKNKDSTTLGYNENEIKKQISTIIENLKNKKIERLFIIGINPYSEIQKEYFKEFFANMNKNEFAISFSYESKKENVMTINVGNYLPLATSIISYLFKDLDIKSPEVTFIFTTCDVMSISNIILLKNNNAPNVYMASCSPTLVNPSVFTTLKKEYNIFETTTPVNDLKKIRQK